MHVGDDFMCCVCLIFTQSSLLMSATLGSTLYGFQRYSKRASELEGLSDGFPSRSSCGLCKIVWPLPGGQTSMYEALPADSYL